MNQICEVFQLFVNGVLIENSLSICLDIQLLNPRFKMIVI